MSPVLFSPLKMRELVLENRIMISPMGQYSAIDGCATDWHLMHLGNLAVSGAAVMMIEATAVVPNGRTSPYDMGMWCDENAAALEPVLAFCRKHGRTHIGIQLQHTGRKGSVAAAWDKQRALSIGEGGWPLSAPSALAYPGRAMPVALTTDGIKDLCVAYSAAATRADRLGLDLVEIHSAHGYLLHSFLSPLTNRRDDEYGGSLENRMRFPLEVFKAVRAAMPAHKPVGFRLSATDWASGGWDVDQSVELARALKRLGCDYVTASSGGAVAEQKLNVHPEYQIPFAERIRREADICTVGIGLITDPRSAERIVATGQADIVALARGMLFNPRWAWHAAMELGAEFTYPRQYERCHPSMRRGDFLTPARGLGS